MKRVGCLMLLAMVLLAGTALAQPQQAHLVIELSAESAASLPLGDVVLMPGDQHSFTLTMEGDDDDMTIGEALEALDPVNGPAALGRSTLTLPDTDTPLEADDPLTMAQREDGAHIRMHVMNGSPADGGEKSLKARLLTQEMPPMPSNKVGSEMAEVSAHATPEPYVPQAVVVRKSALYAQPDEDSFLRSVAEGTRVEVVAWGIGPGGLWHRVVVGNEAYYILSENLIEA